MDKLKIGLYSLTSCSGDILEIANMEEDIIRVLEWIKVVDMNIAMPSTGEIPDIAFVEGAVTRDEEIDFLKDLRKKVKYLIPIGTCAYTGGIIARGPEERRQWLMDVYKETGGEIVLRFPRPVSGYVAVDFSIPGCPIDRNYFLHCLGYLLKGVLPEVPNYPVCMECKMKENECLLHYRGLPCMGPVTRGGCGARQPSFGRPCDGCFGIYDDANVDALKAIFRDIGLGEEEIQKRFDLFLERGCI